MPPPLPAVAVLLSRVLLSTVSVPPFQMPPPLINGTVLSGNSAVNGGGIDNFGGSATLTLTNSTVSGNTAGGSGGGLFNDTGTMTLTSSTVAGQFRRPGQRWHPERPERDADADGQFRQ